VAAAVVFDGEPPLDGLDDSKKLTPETRETLARRIRSCARAWAVASASVEEIDIMNILHASRLAMRRAVEALAVPPNLLLIDGDRGIRSAISQRTVVGGDARVACIAAASILAKVSRDDLMAALDAEHPGYGFARHKGYASPEHVERLRALGPCAAHRRSFLPVRDALFPDGGDGGAPAPPRA
jgi:ribonuclease HII